MLLSAGARAPLFLSPPLPMARDSSRRSARGRSEWKSRSRAFAEARPISASQPGRDNRRLSLRPMPCTIQGDASRVRGRSDHRRAELGWVRAAFSARPASRPRAAKYRSVGGGQDSAADQPGEEGGAALGSSVRNKLGGGWCGGQRLAPPLASPSVRPQTACDVMCPYKAALA
jgi:hypothetical protein